MEAPVKEEKPKPAEGEEEPPPPEEDGEPKKKELNAFAERWDPYKTIACWYLWHSLDNMPK